MYRVEDADINPANLIDGAHQESRDELKLLIERSQDGVIGSEHSQEMCVS